MSAKRILFVDDEPMVLQGLQRMLRQMRGEWEMVFAGGGEAALALMAQTPFDVVVTDMRMPGMNGAELLQEVMRRYPTTVRLILSGHADRDLVTQCVGVAHQYISKPCEPEQLKSTIRNACLPGGDLASEEVKRIVGSIIRLPSVPQLYHRLQEALEDESTSTQSIGDIIQNDIGMTAKVLKLVNSAFFGLRRTVETPHEAVAYLGIETVKTLVLAHGIFCESPSLETQIFNLEGIWHHSLKVANNARAIAAAEHADRHTQEASFVGGILHDVGILLLAANFPEAYDRVVEIVVQEHVPVPLAEQRLFRITHAEVGAYLLGLWGIPAPILDIVKKHHGPLPALAKGFSPIIAVHAADALSGRTNQHPLFEGGELDEAALEAAGLKDRIQIWRNMLCQPTES